MRPPPPSLGAIDDSYHFPADVFALLVDTLIRVNRSKRDVVVFFRGAGITSARLASWEHRIQTNPTQVRKADIARDLLRELNESKGNEPLRLRREVVRRVVDFEDFSACWDKDRLEAQGLVAQVRSLVNAKDTVTRINIERERERAERVRINSERELATAAKNQEREGIRADLSALFADTDHVRRGTVLETVLNRLFRSYGILVREAFRRRGDAGEGTVEQVDGVIELDSHVYLVEMKWHAAPLGVDAVAPHLVRVYNRGGVRGLIISSSGYTEPAIAQVREGLAQKIFVLCELSEIVFLLENRGDLPGLLRKKAHTAQLDKQPFTRIV